MATRQEEGEGKGGADISVLADAPQEEGEDAGGEADGGGGRGGGRREKKRKIKSYVVLGSRFDVDARYVILDCIGQGAYGVVVAAHDEETGDNVAIKKIQSAFEHVTYTKRTLREIRLLRFLKHENVIDLKTILKPIRPSDFDDLYVISELMETDLSSIIKSPQPLTDEHTSFFAYQLLRGLKFLHSSNVIHRDLKPRNLLVNSNCDLKICDFGLARIDFPDMQWKVVAMTDYVATRWYRAPEILMGFRHYTKAVDMWSVGCILAELLGRKPLLPGSDSYHQLSLIIDILGTPSSSLMRKVKLEQVRRFVRELGQKTAFPLEVLYPQANPKAIDLLTKTLAMDPRDRWTAEQSLDHPYFAGLHCPDDEPAGPEIPREAFEFERMFLTKETLREEILHEVRLYNQDEEEDADAQEVAEAAAEGQEAKPTGTGGRFETEADEDVDPGPLGSGLTQDLSQALPK